MILVEIYQDEGGVLTASVLSNSVLAGAWLITKHLKLEWYRVVRYATLISRALPAVFVLYLCLYVVTYLFANY